MVNKSKKIEVNEMIKPNIINGLDLTFSSSFSLFSLRRTSAGVSCVSIIAVWIELPVSKLKTTLDFGDPSLG